MALEASRENSQPSMQRQRAPLGLSQARSLKIRLEREKSGSYVTFFGIGMCGLYTRKLSRQTGLYFPSVGTTTEVQQGGHTALPEQVSTACERETCVQ
jgi:hypothetical protein